jgi:two-component system cell cycle sensor histidine kinase/response regulator CckA
LRDSLTNECRRREEANKYGPLAAIFGMIYDQALHPVGIVGADGILQYANRKACELIGKVPSELTGRPFWETPWWTHSAAEQDKLREALRRALGGESVRFETTHIASDGRVHDMDFTLRPVRDTAGQILYLISEAWNITEHKAAKEALEQTHRLLEAVLDQSPVPMVVISAPDLVVNYCNRAATDILGVSDEGRSVGLTLAEAQKRQTWKDFDSDGKPIDLLDMPLARALHGEITRDKEYRIVRKDGTQRWELVSATPVYTRTGKMLAGLITFPDITERKQAEAAIRESRERLEFVLRGAELGSWDWDIPSGAVHFDDRWAQMLGYDLEEIEPHVRSWERLVHPDDMPKVREVLDAHLEGKTAFYEVENRLRHKSGTWVWVLDKGKVITRDADGKALRAAGTHLDITYRKQAEEALRVSQIFLETIIENSPFSMWVSDEKGTLIRMNQACRDLLKVTDDDLVGKYNVLQDNIVEQQGAMPLVKRVFEKGERVCFTLRYDSAQLRSLRLGKTTQVILEVTISPVLDPRGRVVHAIIQHLDMTERTQAEGALRTSEERFKRLVQNSSDIITVLDEKGIVTSVSGPLERILGYTPEEMIGACGFDYIHPDDKELTMKILAEGVEQAGNTKSVEYRFRHKEGKWVFMEAVGANLLNDPVVKGMVANIREITERKSSEQERHKLQEQLQQAMKMEAVGRLAGGVAHDFNNLLTVISGYVELARMQLMPPDPLLRSLDGIHRAAESAAALTNQLLAFSRRQIIEPKVLNLNDLVGGLVKMLTRLIGEDIELQTVLAGDLGSVKVDPGQFEQVLVNLAVNARDALPDGGRLVIETANSELDQDYCARHPQMQPGMYVLLAVSDTGYGMNDDVKQHLFEPFFTTKPKGQGTGLGLATIFGVVKQAGGAIEVYSEIDRGTTFKIYLPRVEEQAERLVKETPSRELARGDETILLVEDDEGVRDVALTILEHLGYRVLTAANGGEAFMIVEKYAGHIDLLMTDVVMPGMNGRELAERLLRLKPEMKVLFTSGYTENVIVHHGVVDENLNFIGKPYSMQALARKMREVLGIQS